VSSVRTISAFLFLFLNGAALAQTNDPARAETVSWTLQPASAARQGDRLKLTLSGAVQPGWHVYALKQAPDGPTPLLVTLDSNTIAAADGAVAGSPAVKFRDPAFDLDTHYYESAFAVTVPVRLKPHLAAGPQTIPVSVRFQTCNGRICQPPKTVHLSASVNLPAGG
jgi:DsbC/DsbD-like thiol-disulfide interchange protein